MAGKKQTVQQTGSRQAAYSARNRARLIKDAQIVLAEIGPSATIEQIAAHAEVSPTTIYKYFENKDQLFLEALGEAWIGFLIWANQLKVPGDRLERTLDSGRKVFYARKSHPLFAEMLHNCLTEMPDFLVQSDRGEGKNVFKEIAASGELKADEFEKRYVLWINIYTGILKSVFVTKELSPAEADVALGIGLSVWGISEAKAKKLISRPLEFAPIE
jgi:AcrR family transcriptional regulator|uniref:TetR/AcrR family transcriptional regulator n=1 Tax=Candidatus Planktophila sp. TaxID=2175601 RepID=UPI004049C70A